MYCYISYKLFLLLFVFAFHFNFYVIGHVLRLKIRLISGRSITLLIKGNCGVDLRKIRIIKELY